MIVKLKGFIEFCGEDYIDLDVKGANAMTTTCR